MKKLLPMIVAVKRITFDDCPIRVSEFSEDGLNHAAQCSLEIGGFVVPPILLRVGSEANPSYHILEGYFQCYAALKAQAIDSMKGETIPAIVIRDDDPSLDSFLRQLDYIKNDDNS